MAMYGGVRLSKCCRILHLNFSTTYSVTNKWRLEQGLEPEPRAFGPLTNLPDYSFVDGRPVPLSYRKLQKLKFQQELYKKVVTLSHELDVGLAKYHEKQEAERLERETILKNKLKPKGAALLTTKKKNLKS